MNLKIFGLPPVHCHRDGAVVSAVFQDIPLANVPASLVKSMLGNNIRLSGDVGDTLVTAIGYLSEDGNTYRRLVAAMSSLTQPLPAPLH